MAPRSKAELDVCGRSCWLGLDLRPEGPKFGGAIPPCKDEVRDAAAITSLWSNGSGGAITVGAFVVPVRFTLELDTRLGERCVSSGGIISVVLPRLELPGRMGLEKLGITTGTGCAAFSLIMRSISADDTIVCVPSVFMTAGEKLVELIFVGLLLPETGARGTLPSWFTTGPEEELSVFSLPEGDVRALSETNTSSTERSRFGNFLLIMVGVRGRSEATGTEGFAFIHDESFTILSTKAMLGAGLYGTAAESEAGTDGFMPLGNTPAIEASMAID